MSDNKGLLLVTMEPPAGLEEEFNDWYDTEHFPQRRGLPGFESASRWACLSGWPRWVALYDLASVGALDTPEYRAVSGANSTPWSRRILPRTVGRSRVVAEQIAPGGALSLAPETVSRLLLARFPSVPAAREATVMQEVAEQGAGPLRPVQLRLFRSPAKAGADLWVIAEFGQPVLIEPLAEAFGEVAGIGATLLNLYTPYHRG
jgi:hypothetical protein